MKKSFRGFLIAISALVVMATILSSCSVVSAIIGEGAPETIVLDITATNLSFENSVCIRYSVAIDRNVVDETKVRMLIWDEPQDAYTYGSQLVELAPIGSEDIKGVGTCLIFEYRGLVASQMTDDVYAVAYTEINGEKCYSDAKKYSILQYAYNMLGKTGSNETDDNELKDLLNNMLAYGALAQQYTGYKTDSLATDDFYQVKLAGGLFEDNFNHGLYKEGTQLKVSAPESVNGCEFVAWRDKNGKVVSTSHEFTMTVGASNVVYFAVYKIPGEASNLEYTLNEDETAYIVTGIGGCTDDNIKIPSDINGKLVTEIAEGAFENCTNIKSVEMGVSISKIGADAFSGCTSLTTIYYEGSRAQWNSVVGSQAVTIRINFAIDNSWELGGIPVK